MEPAFFAWLALLAGFFALLLERSVLPIGLISGGAGRLPRRLVPSEPMAEPKLPASAASAERFLAERLANVGFERLSGTIRVTELESRFRDVFLVPFVHPRERALFLLVIECGLTREAELMIHIITPLSGGRRVETSTLAALHLLRAPTPITLDVVTDAESVEEIWSRHRRALLDFCRDERLEIAPDGWRGLAAEVYESWLEIAARAQRLRISSDGHSFRVHTPTY